MNTYEQISNWLKGYSTLIDWIYFNVTEYEAGVISLNSVTSSRYAKEFVTGDKEVELIVSIDMIKPYDSGTSTTNLEAIQEVNNFTAWIESKNKLKSYPNLGTGKTVNSIKVLSNAPTLSVDNSLMLGKYQFSISINYREEK